MDIILYVLQEKNSSTKMLYVEYIYIRYGLIMERGKGIKRRRQGNEEMFSDEI